MVAPTPTTAQTAHKCRNCNRGARAFDRWFCDECLRWIAQDAAEMKALGCDLVCPCGACRRMRALGGRLLGDASGIGAVRVAALDEVRTAAKAVVL